tara:strand:- start:4184 stop:4483 length:300 start_codon:yes stop_codon:yes gene_type:complete
MRLIKHHLKILILMVLCVGGIVGCGSSQNYVIRDPDPTEEILNKADGTLVLPQWEWVGCGCDDATICMSKQDFILFTQFMIAMEDVLAKHDVQVKYQKN